jgi:hypothetical protein
MHRFGRGARRAVLCASRRALPAADAADARHFGYYDPALLGPFFAELRERARSAAVKVHEAFEHAAGLRGLSAEWRELLLGGATRSVLRSMTVPVLMSH